MTTSYGACQSATARPYVIKATCTRLLVLKSDLSKRCSSSSASSLLQGVLSASLTASVHTQGILSFHSTQITCSHTSAFAAYSPTVSHEDSEICADVLCSCKALSVSEPGTTLRLGSATGDVDTAPHGEDVVDEGLAAAVCVC